MQRSVSKFVLLVSLFATFGGLSAADLRVAFLGDRGHHRPAERAAQLVPVLEARGIRIDYTEDMGLLSPARLNAYDGLIIYGNIGRISPDQERALLAYVASGKGLIPLHCATYCFLNSPKYIALVGGQFRRHGGEVFSTEIDQPHHPIMKGFGGFESWDETYVHHKHNESNRLVLEYRRKGMQAAGKEREPWTWVRTHGRGRVFYTAWGHDHRTWGHPGFHNLVERGIRWACGSDTLNVPDYRDPALFAVPKMTAKRADRRELEYVDVGAKIPNYRPRARWGTQDAPLTLMQKPLSPEESQKHFVTPIGFEMQLFATEENFVAKPISMNWDERGRLWICETVDYPNEMRKPGEGRDRVRICEDTDGDGRGDKFTVFAEKLSIPTAIAFHRGGVIVQDGAQTMYLKDTDGDDRADVRKVLISGWSMGDTHGGVSNFQYGLDNWVWAMQGYNNSKPKYGPGGEKSHRGFRNGFFRFKLDDADPPNVTDIEFIRSTNNNTWGLGISEDGIVFGSTANRNPSVYMPIANRYYERVLGWSSGGLGTIANNHLFEPITERVRQVDQHGGYTAGAGHALYTARSYPQNWWNRTAFVCGPTGHLVGTYVLRGEGSDFRSSSPCNLVASTDEWSAPIMAEVGPDGFVWILDWYNFIIQHNPTPRGFERGPGNAYETDLRDKTRGRIYRLVYKGTDGIPSETPKDLSKAEPRALVAALNHPTRLWRRHAQRLLVERGKDDVVPALLARVKDPSVDAVGLNAGAIHALWTLKGLGVIEVPEVAAAVRGALKHPSAGVRRNAARVSGSAEAIVSSGVLRDPDAQVRLAALLGLADSEASDVAGHALAEYAASGRDARDRWIPDALTSAAAVHAVAFLDALSRAKKSSDLSATVAPRVGEHLARSAPSAAAVARLLAAMGTANSRTAESIILGIARGWPAEHQIELSAQAEASFVPLLDRVPAGAKGQLIRLASLWGSKKLEKYVTEVVDSLLESIGNGELADKDRVAAGRELVSFRPNDEALVPRLLDQVGPQASPTLASGLIGALAESTAKNVGTELVDRAKQMTLGAKAAALRVLLGRPETTATFLDGVQSGKVFLADLELDQKQFLRQHPDGKLRARATELLKAGGGLPSPDREKVIHELIGLTKVKGDAKLGKAVYNEHCARCHKHSGEGADIGPDLTGMAVHPKEELLTHIIDPSRSVEGNFRTYTVITAGGKIFTGMMAGESATSIEVIDAEAKRHAIQRKDILKLDASTKSLMPDGFEKQASNEDLKNLLEFLTDKGRYVPISIASAATAISTKGLFHSGDNGPDRMIFADWKPKVFQNVPFLLTDPQGKTKPNLILMHGTNGSLPPKMPKSVKLPCNSDARAVHLLSGVSGWGYPAYGGRSVTLTVRLHYADGKTEDHGLKNGVHFSDYIRRVDVPESKFAFELGGGRQVRYLAVYPKRVEEIREIEFVKADDPTSPMVMAVTVERRE